MHIATPTMCIVEFGLNGATWPTQLLYASIGRSSAPPTKYGSIAKLDVARPHTTHTLGGQPPSSHNPQVEVYATLSYLFSVSQPIARLNCLAKFTISHGSRVSPQTTHLNTALPFKSLTHVWSTFETFIATILT
ncbi:MAG: hypothetical protein QW688_04350 [Thermoprotei archaeon]